METAPTAFITPRQIRVNRFFKAAVIGGAAWILSLSMYLALIALNMTAGTWWIWLNYALFLIFFGALMTQYRMRDADEFAGELWTSSSSTAFIVTVAWMLFASQIEAWLNVFYSQWSGTPVRTAYAYFWAFQMPMLTFYAVFFMRYWRDRE